MASAAQRRSDRVSLTLLLEASGKDINEQEFTGPARTMQINRTGAVILLDRDLRPDQRIEIRRMAPLEAHRHTQVRIVGQFGLQKEGFVYGVEILEPQSDIWNIEFPPIAESEEAVARMLLECTYCRSREVVYLNEFELGGFEKNRGTARHCKVCDVPTIWTQAPHEVAKIDPVKFAASVHAESGSASAASLTDAERRHSLRLQTRLTACVRLAGSDDELAVCEEISAEGLCFRSKRRFEEQSRIDIAVPYADATANIFVPARVVRVEPTASAGLFRHGVEFLKVSAQSGS